MNRNLCYGTDCDEEQCRCHDEDIKIEMAIADYVSSLKGLKEVLEKLYNSNKTKLDTIEKLNPFLKEIIAKANGR